MAIEIVDFPISNCDVPQQNVNVYQRVNPINSQLDPIKPP